MISVTYNQLANLDDATISKIEALTGSRASYGLDTPISIYSIVTGLDLQTGLEALEYVPDSEIIRKLIAVSLVRSKQGIWEAVWGGDTRFTQLLDLLENYAATNGAEGTPARDYCDDPIPGFYGTVPPGVLTDRMSSIQASSDALNLSDTPQVHSFWMTNGAPWTQDMVDYWNTLAVGRWTMLTQGLNTIEPVANLTNVGVLPDYTLVNIVDQLSKDGDWFFKQSLVYDTVVVEGYTTYGAIVHRPINDSGNAAVNYLYVAGQSLVSALSMAVSLVLNDAGSLPLVASTLQDASINYAGGSRIRIMSRLARLRDMRRGTFPFLTGGSVNDVEQLVLDSGENKRAELCRNVTFVQSFSGGNPTLSLDQRALMEIAVRAGIQSARSAKATELFDALTLEYTGLAELENKQILVDSTTPYLV
jgi:hypothetical protein